MNTEDGMIPARIAGVEVRLSPAAFVQWRAKGRPGGDVPEPGTIYRHSDRGIYDGEPNGPHPCPYCERLDTHEHRFSPRPSGALG